MNINYYEKTNYFAQHKKKFIHHKYKPTCKPTHKMEHTRKMNLILKCGWASIDWFKQNFSTSILFPFI